MKQIQDGSGKGKLTVGAKVWFRGEERPYTVQASDDRFAVCTKPFNARRTVVYTIVDNQRRVRGTENLIFGMGFESRQDCEEALQRLAAGKSGLSYRNFVPLDILRVEAGRAALKGE